VKPKLPLLHCLPLFDKKVAKAAKPLAFSGVGLTKGTDSKRLIYLRGFTYILRSAQQLK
jgi:hypothetical protein